MPSGAHVAILNRGPFENPRISGAPMGFRPRKRLELTVVDNHTVSRSPNPVEEDIFDIRVLPSGPEPLPPLFRHT
jgi:hypothetical protein